MTKLIRVPQLAWHGAKSLDLAFPDNWEITVNNMAGYDRPALLDGQIRAAIRFPIGTPPLRTLAKGKLQVAIIFDDIQRATRTAEIVPFILEELAEAGIKDEQIRFIAATGLHAAMGRPDFVKKLGEDILGRFAVYNHNAFSCCVDIGTTSYGTRLLVNAEVMQCDLKIGLGSVVPHAFAGFGGGAKIILPGICHYETVVNFHKLGSKYKKENPDQAIGVGVIENNLLRLNMEEAAQKVGLDFKVDTLMNSYGETAAIFAGDLKNAYPRALQDASNHYDTPVSRDNDIVIANSYAKVAECESGLEIAFPAVKAAGGQVVLIGNSPDGHVAHYLAGPWGKTNRSPLQMQVKLPSNVRSLIVLNSYPDRSLLGYFAEPAKVVMVTRWEEVLELLQKNNQDGCKVAVYPDADIQYCSSQGGTSALSFESN